MLRVIFFTPGEGFKNSPLLELYVCANRHSACYHNTIARGGLTSGVIKTDIAQFEGMTRRIISHYQITLVKTFKVMPQYNYWYIGTTMATVR